MWQQLKDWLKSQTEYVEALKQSNHYLLNKSHDVPNPVLSTQTGKCLEP